ncbi:hypothetical protein ACT8ZV_19625 [Nocardioides sp. MAHUQ-72]
MDHDNAPFLDGDVPLPVERPVTRQQALGAGLQPRTCVRRSSSS